MDFVIWFLVVLILTYIIYKSGILEIILDLLKTLYGYCSVVYVSVKPKSVFTKIIVALVSVAYGIFALYTIIAIYGPIGAFLPFFLNLIGFIIVVIINGVVYLIIVQILGIVVELIEG